MPLNGRYRILSLDGGGSWALIEAMALLDLYGNVPGHQVLNRFDLVAANSGGSIVAAALAANYTLQQIVDLFASPATNVRGQLFVPLPLLDQPERIFGLGPKYSTVAKLTGLQTLLGNGPVPLPATPLAAVPGAITPPPPALAGLAITGPTHFIIPSFDYDAGRARFFRSNTTSPAANFSAADVTTTLACAVHASSDAPVNYFDLPAAFGGGQFWDGAVAGYNNPVLAGVLEILALGVARNQIDVLSIGTANVALPPGVAGNALMQPPRTPGWPRLLTDIGVMSSSILDDPPDVATFHAHFALTQSVPAGVATPVQDGPVVRLNPLIRPILDATNTWVAPALNPAGAAQSLADFKALAALGMDATQQSDVNLIVELATAWIAGTVRNQPIRWRTTEDVGCEIGFDNYPAARALTLTRFR
jgi:uncharacterized protein